MTPDQHLPESKRGIPAFLLKAMYDAPEYVEPEPPLAPIEWGDTTIPVDLPRRPAPQKTGPDWERRIPWIAAGIATVIVGSGVVLVVLNWSAIVAALKVAGLVLAVLVIAVVLRGGGESVTVTGRGLKVWRS